MNALPKLLKISLLPLLVASLQAASSYQVQSGDTLSSIARKNGTTSSQIMRDNGISNPNLLKIGQVLKVSGSNNKPAASKPQRSTATTSGSYSVKPGETLYAIARKHGLSVSQLTNLNPGLNPAQLSVGQKLNTQGSGTSKTKAAPKPKALASPQPKPTTQPKAIPKPVIAQAILPPIITHDLKDISLTSSNLAAKKKAEVPASISSVMVNKEISFGALASKHRTSTRQLNALNGWSLKPTTILAKGSEIYVPGI